MDSDARSELMESSEWRVLQAITLALWKGCSLGMAADLADKYVADIREGGDTAMDAVLAILEQSK